MGAHPESLLARLQTLPDPRRRQGRMYPLPALVGMLLLGVLHGRDSLRGAWVWAERHWPSLWRPLGARSPHFPCYQTVRGLMVRLVSIAARNAPATCGNLIHRHAAT